MNAVVARLTLRGLMNRRRALLVLALSLPLFGLALAIRLTGNAGQPEALLVLQLYGLAALLPLVALIAGTGVFGAEIDDGTIVYLLSTPIPRPVIVTTKLAVAVATTAVMAGLPMLLAGLIVSGGQDGVALGMTVAALAGGITYTAVFVLLSLLSRHAVIIGLAYAMIWEGAVGRYVAGARDLSVQQWALAVGDAVTSGHALHPVLPFLPALLLLATVTAGATAIAGQRLRSFSLTGDE